MTLTAGPEAGWYPDPAGDSAWRWWDGATWTDHLRARESEPVSAPVAVVTGPHPVSAPVAVQPEPVLAQPEPVAPQPEPVAAQPEPVAAHAEPAAQPEPVAAQPQPQPQAGHGIPQPGEVAPAPAAAPAGGPTSMTPPIPVTDQMYWHSSAAEVVEVPRVTHTRQPTPRTPAAVPSYVRDWNDLGSPHTPGIWLLAFSPLLGGAVYLAVAEAMRTAGLPAIVAFGAGVIASLLLHWVFAALDTRALAARGYHAPRLSWMLLFPPLAYFIMRGRAVRRESKPAWGPELVYILCTVVVVGGVVAMSALLLAMLSSMGAI